MAIFWYTCLEEGVEIWKSGKLPRWEELEFKPFEIQRSPIVRYRKKVPPHSLASRPCSVASSLSIEMCGRGRRARCTDDVIRAYHRTHAPVRTVNMDRYRPSYNVLPAGLNVPVVRREDGADGYGVVLNCMKWGRIPSFTKKTEKPDFYRMFNARSESICEKASFRRLAPKSLCLVAVERMPVILGDEESTDTWLDGSSSSKFDSLLKPYEDPDLVWYPVTRAMGKVSMR